MPCLKRGMSVQVGMMLHLKWGWAHVHCYARTLRTVRMLTVWIWECGKAGSRSGTLDSDGPIHLVPLTKDYEYSGWGSVLIHMTCLVGKCNSWWHWWH